MRKKVVEKISGIGKQFDDGTLKLEKKRKRKKRRAIILGIIFVPLLFLGGLSCFLGKDDN